MKDEKSIRAKEYTRKYTGIYVAMAFLCVLVGVALSLTVLRLTDTPALPTVPNTQTGNTETPSSTPTPDVTATPTETVKPPVTGKVEIKTSSIGNSQMSMGSLIIVNGTNTYDPANSKNEVIVVREQSDRKVGVNVWGISLTMDTYKAVNEMQTALWAEVNEDYTLTLTIGYEENDSTSELGTGLSFKVKFMKKSDGASYPLNDAAVSKHYQWIKENAWRFGLIFRYPEDKTLFTGHEAVVSQMRYVGKLHAKYMYENKLCLEEYLQALDDYTFNAPLLMDFEDAKYRLYYIPVSDGTSTDIQYRAKSPVETYGTLTVSGDNMTGFVVIQQYFEK